MNPHLQLAPEILPVESSPLAEESLIRVVLADDHALMRRSLRLVLEGDETIAVVAEAEDLATVERNVRRHHPRVHGVNAV